MSEVQSRAPQLEAETSPAGLIFLPEKERQFEDVPSLEELVEKFFDEDWTMAETILQSIAEFYPNLLETTISRVQTTLLLERGPMSLHTEPGIVREELKVYLFNLAEGYRKNPLARSERLDIAS